MSKTVESFKFHGVEFIGESGGELYGSCPFCTDPKHFYANTETGQWDCKKCGENGNVITFLEKVHALHLEDTTDANYTALSRLLKTPKRNLKQAELAFNGTAWHIPCRWHTGKIHDIHVFDPEAGTVRSTPGRAVDFFGLEQLAATGPETPVWLCNDILDAIKLRSTLRRAKRKDVVVASVAPYGFSTQDAGHFRNRDVRIAFANTANSFDGTIVVRHFLTGIARRVRYVDWPSKKVQAGSLGDFIGDTRRGRFDADKKIDHLEAWLHESNFPIAHGINDPHVVAKHILASHFCHDGELTLRFYQGQWYHWDGQAYGKLLIDELRARLNGQLNQLYRDSNSDKAVTQNQCQNVLRAIESLTLIRGEVSMPSWVGEEFSPSFDPLLSMANGLLDLRGALEKADHVTTPHSPGWFCMAKWDYPYDSKARCPIWRKFLKEVLPDRDARFLLQEFLGYSLTFDNQFHKFLVLVGEGANGKSVVTEVATRLIGIDNVTHVPLERFGDRFGMAHTIGKLANVVAEIGDVKHIAEDVLKAVVSGDRIKIEHKYQQPTHATPTVRLIFATNNLPQFSDRSEGLWRRILIIPFDLAIPEHQQDRLLARRICDVELPGILNWALVGLRRLHDQNGFTIPKRSKRAAATLRRESNPVREYLLSRYRTKTSRRIACRRMYKAYDSWAMLQMGRERLNEQQFGKEVRRAFPGIRRNQVRSSGGREYVYVGLEAKR